METSKFMNLSVDNYRDSITIHQIKTPTHWSRNIYSIYQAIIVIQKSKERLEVMSSNPVRIVLLSHFVSTIFTCCSIGRPQ